MERWREFALVGIGGAVGAMARYGVGLFGGAPWTTFGINVSGSFLLGALVGASPPTPWRLLLGVGVLGGFTTFSAFAVETLTLIEAREWGQAGAYAFGSVFLSFFAAGTGLALARAISSR